MTKSINVYNFECSILRYIQYASIKIYMYTNTNTNMNINMHIMKLLCWLLLAAYCCVCCSRSRNRCRHRHHDRRHWRCGCRRHHDGRSPKLKHVTFIRSRSLIFFPRISFFSFTKVRIKRVSMIMHHAWCLHYNNKETLLYTNIQNYIITSRMR